MPRRGRHRYHPVRVLLGLAVLALALTSVAASAGAKTGHARPGRRASAAAACPGAGISAAGARLGSLRAAVLCLVNRQRSARGLPALHEDARLDRSAQGWTSSMVANRQFTHGSGFAGRIIAAGLVWSAAGENIATGFQTPAAVVAAWMGSEGHCRNILAPTFSAIGIGVLALPVGAYATGGATWTQDFALPMGQRAPSANSGPMNGCPY